MGNHWYTTCKWQKGWISGQLLSFSAAGLDPTCLHTNKSVSCTLKINNEPITFCQNVILLLSYLWPKAPRSEVLREFTFFGQGFSCI